MNTELTNKKEETLSNLKTLQISCTYHFPIMASALTKASTNGIIKPTENVSSIPPITMSINNPIILILCCLEKSKITFPVVSTNDTVLFLSKFEL